ncbi:SDR family NAD(P)-dependent oxidoreductase [Acinetobacter sp. WU_MDCI_Abxb74]|uniref:SDR family NAD(P)-dependent oxidoreductase n=1 Tax=Acinetobacter sp. WU_MDCI_Abxb74 TaxID=2850072 RepID=UPI0021CD756E|nr:SDR family NAD(P)-dependent oxidoreductase [Acinetobacter sp. WU_MDCI_Abxb74]MCU4424133.1 SDR family NAD(P)-dependent oxidoreductase [Acinetobacter sp. WU_MDCI_Abxb74]
MMKFKVKNPVSTESIAAKQGTDAPTAVLIGATGGLGNALAKLLVAEGFRIVLAARSENDATALTGRSDGSAIYLRADVTDPASLEKLAAAAFDHLGRIDAIVNLAGISPRKPIEDYTTADVDALMAINVKGPIFVTQAFLPILRKQAAGGVIVHLGGAMDGRVALPFMSAYVATRGALASYVQGVNRELAGTNVVLSFFGPVPSNTESESPYFEMWRKMGVDLCEPEVVAREILTTIRQRRQVHVMGGWLLKMLTVSNAVSPSIADAIGLRKFAKLIQQHSPR